MGYSSGALVALQMAIRHPQLVDKLIVISGAFRSDGYYPEVLNAVAQMPSAAPMIAADVKAPTLLMFADADAIRTEVRWASTLDGVMRAGQDAPPASPIIE